MHGELEEERIIVSTTGSLPAAWAYSISWSIPILFKRKDLNLIVKIEKWSVPQTRAGSQLHTRETLKLKGQHAILLLETQEALEILSLRYKGVWSFRILYVRRGNWTGGQWGVANMATLLVWSLILVPISDNGAVYSIITINEKAISWRTTCGCACPHWSH